MIHRVHDSDLTAVQSHQLQVTHHLPVILPPVVLHDVFQAYQELDVIVGVLDDLPVLFLGEQTVTTHDQHHLHTEQMCSVSRTDPPIGRSHYETV